MNHSLIKQIEAILTNRKAKFKVRLVLFAFFLFVTSMLVFYWILPFGNITEFRLVEPGNYNFYLSNVTDSGMQFYENMRYQDSLISYRIESCPLQKKDEIRRALDIISNLTILNFYNKQNSL